LSYRRKKLFITIKILQVTAEYFKKISPAASEKPIDRAVML